VRFEFDVDGRVRTVTIERAGDTLSVALDGQVVDVDVARLGGGGYSLRLPASGRQREVLVTTAGRNGTMNVAVCGTGVAVTRRACGVPGRPGAGVRGDGPQRLVAPMPGKIVRILVRPGDEVALRQGVIVVEAMKMENELRAGRAGLVREVLVVEGASVEQGAPLVVIE
jgi:biotin carboxyl carrier protein